MFKSKIYLPIGTLTATYFIIPYFELKLLIAGAIITILLKRLENGIKISKIVQVFVIAVIFSLSYLSVPYWGKNETFFDRTTVYLFLLVLYLAFIYLYYSKSNEINISTTKNSHLVFMILFIVFVIINYNALQNSIPFKGDTDHHIFTGFSLLGYYSGYYINIFWFMVAIIFGGLFLRSRKMIYLIIMGVAFSAIGITYVYFYKQTYFFFFLRYPILFYYINDLFSIPIVGLIKESLKYHEGFYRLLPFLSVLGIAITTVSTIRDHTLKIMFGIAILTIPSLIYYSTLTYIELPMLYFIITALVSFEISMRESLKKEIWGLAIICVILGSFLKENSIIYASVFVLVGALVIMSRSEKPLIAKMFFLIQYASLIVIPSLIYIIFRPKGMWPYVPHLSNLLLLDNYKVLALSLWEQFGIFVPFAIGSIIYLLYKKQYYSVLTGTLLIGIFCVFYMLHSDPIVTESNGWLIHYKESGNIITNKYAGYSRFNLYMLPGLLLLTIVAVREMEMSSIFNKKYILTIFIIIILINVLLSPINLLSGQRKAGWGDYAYATSEFDFPYDELYGWLHAQDNVKSICITGRSDTYRWGDEFYKRKYALNFKIRTSNNCNETDFDYIIYHKNLIIKNSEFKINKDHKNKINFRRGKMELKVYMKE